MKNCLIIFTLFLLVGFTNSLMSQVTFNVSEETVAANGSVQVDITTSGFSNVVLAQFSLSWDSDVINFSSITNITNELVGFGAASFGTPDNATDPGQFTVSWSEPNTDAETVPDGTRLFSIVFTAVGNMCDETNISIIDEPTRIQVADFDLNELPFVLNDGKVMIEGTNCSGGDNLLGLIAPDLTAMPGENVCVPISVKNFTGVESFDAGITWNTSVLSYQEVTNFGPIPDFSAEDFNVESVNQGELGFFWLDFINNPPIALDLSDGTVLFEVCFEVIGSIGSNSVISYPTSGNFEPLFTGSEGDIPYSNVSGSVSVGDGGGGDDRFTLEIDKIEAAMGTEACVNVVTKNFEDMATVQYTIEFDPTILEYTRVQNFNVEDLSTGSFNLDKPSELNLTWSSPTGATVPDNTSMYQMCFNVIGDCNDGGASSLDFINGNTSIQISAYNENDDPVVVDNLNLISGEIAVANCGVSYQLLSITDVACPGESSGGIVVAVTGASDDCTCTWENAQGNQVSSGTIGGDDCSLVGQPAGTYTFRVSCPGEGEVFSKQETISETPPINIQAAVTNVSCGEQGTIDLTVTGGTSPYTYAWNPDLGSDADQANLAVGTYTVTVTDANDCTATASYDIVEETTDLEISGQTTNNPSCNGDTDGSIAIQVSGGCPDENSSYSIVWRDGDGMDIGMGLTLDGLSAGSYTVVVSDASDPVLSVEETITLSEPSAIDIDSNVSPASDGDNGAIQLSVSGGTSPYDFAWSPDQGNTDNPTGLMAGNYSVTVTDANGCTDSRSIDVSAGGPEVIDLDTDSGSCSANCEGIITGNLKAGTTPVTLTLSGGPTAGTVTLNAPGDFSFSDLCPGTYTLTATDGNNDEVVFNDLQIIESDPIIIESESKCTEEGASSGSIEISVSGGNGSYTFVWSNGQVTQNLTNLSRGTYSVLVEDANGCEAIANDILVNLCNPELCYQSISVITPNGDGDNERFIISCLEGLDNRLGVYDRSGIRVFEAVNYNNDWDGTDTSGNPLPEGSYMWALEVNLGSGGREVYTGTFTILRDF